MKKILITTLTALILPAALTAGLNFGLIKATKKRVDKVDAKVAEKKEEIRIAAINHAPVLTWTGEAGYTADGLTPETGTSTMTFTFRVKYTDADNDAPASGYPKVHIKKSGSEISGSPFTMTHVSGTNNTGAIYSYSATLSPGTDYTYNFEAFDFKNAIATGTPASQVSSPHVAGWVIQTLDSPNYLVSGTSLKLDSNGYPHISYYGTDLSGVNSALKYAKWTGLSWSTEIVKSDGSPGGNTSLALDSSNNPHIAYSTGPLVHAKWTGSWQTEMVDNTGTVKWPSIALDSNGYSSIAYYAVFIGLRYAKWNGSTWQLETILPGTDIATGISLVLDSSSNPHISCVANGALTYIKWSP